LNPSRRILIRPKKTKCKPHRVSARLHMAPAGLSELVGNICKSDAPKGPSPAYSPAHVIKLLRILEAEETMGRMTLAKRLGIGEGSVRTIVKRLTEMSLISVDAVGGCHLTPQGQSVVSELRKLIVSTGLIDLKEMGIVSPAFASHLRGIGAIPTATRLRDEAVRSGAEGMIVFQGIKGRISLPSISEDISKEYPAIDNFLRSRFNPKNRDVLLVSFSSDPIEAEMGALTVSLNLIYALLYQKNIY
jgi:hypothetical protein